MNFIDFGMMSDLMLEYDEYVEKCKKTNVKPLEFKTWWNELE